MRAQDANNITSSAAGSTNETALVPPSGGGLAHTLENLLAKEFDDGDAAAGGLNTTGPQFNAGLSQDGAVIQTVVAKHDGGDAEDGGDKGGQAGVADRLIDRVDNTWVLSKPGVQAGGEGGGMMQLLSDASLVADVTTLLVATACGGALCAFFKQPSLVGFLAAGAAVGPGGLDLLSQLVQLETLCGLGALIMLFCLGLEFGNSKGLGAVRGVAFGGGALAIGACAQTGALCAWMAGSALLDGAFIGLVLSMSSTAIVLRCLQERPASGGSTAGHIAVGMLVTQDCCLGLCFAILPALSGSGPHRGADVSRAVVSALFRSAVLVAGVAGFARWMLPRTLAWSASRGAETHALLALAYAMTLSQGAARAGVSAELGAFLAGLSIAASPPLPGSGPDGLGPGEKLLHLLAPVRGCTTPLFLASLGMLLHPPFLLHHAAALLTACAVIMTVKTALCAAVVRCFGHKWRTALAVGMSLSQAGEFALTLLSRASAAGMLPRPAYLLLLGSSALSLLVTPAVFRLQDAGGLFAAQHAAGHGAAGHGALGPAASPSGPMVVITSAQPGDGHLSPRRRA